MSGFSSIALPGSVPTFPSSSSTWPMKYGIPTFGVDGKEGKRVGGAPSIRVKKVKVEIFDLSDAKQVRRYERLWASLLEKSARMEVVVDSHRDLVRRADGTSYWMKYVEYVEFEGAVPVGMQGE